MKSLLVLKKGMKRKRGNITELAAIATSLHNIYSGMENLLKRALKFKGVSLKMSESWHKDLLIYQLII